jgi:serine phosphatase RsbU (regulator of sigma subunit)
MPSGGTAPVSATVDADRASFRWGVAMVAALAAIYWLIAPVTGYPLSMLILAPLFTAVTGGPRAVVGVGVVATVTATSIGLLDGALDASELVARLVVLALGFVAAVWLAVLRRRREAALLEASLTVALMDTFQAELAPTLSSPSRVSLEARYLPGEERLQLGGDFIDAVELPDGGVAFVVGDVCGHGAGAAALGAAVRNAWRGVVAASADDLPTWFDAVERAVLAEDREIYVTMLTGRLEPDRSSIELASAGHPPPVLVSDGAELVALRPRTPLGIRSARPVEVRSLSLGPGACLLAYTDGLIENRRSPAGERWTEEELVSWLDAHGGIDLDELVAHFGPDGFADDVAVLALTIPVPSTASGVERADRSGPTRPGAD